MPLTGQAKVDYQREYMRRRRSNTKSKVVRPKPENVRPFVRPKQQSTYPMMIGYVPPRE